MAIALEEVMEAAARGVIRARDARNDGFQGAGRTLSGADLVHSGFFVDVILRAGGRPFDDVIGRVSLNPQPLPPGPAQAGQIE